MIWEQWDYGCLKTSLQLIRTKLRCSLLGWKCLLNRSEIKFKKPARICKIARSKKQMPQVHLSFPSDKKVFVNQQTDDLSIRMSSLWHSLKKSPRRSSKTAKLTRPNNSGAEMNWWSENLSKKLPFSQYLSSMYTICWNPFAKQLAG